MLTKSIKDRNIFKILGEDALTTYYGCDQEWYMTEWQRNSGCGPTVVTNIIHYLNCMHIGSSPGIHTLTKIEALSKMEDVWKYVTPTIHGIPTTKLLNDLVMNYTKSKSLNIKLNIIDIHEDLLLRPKFQLLLMFLDKALNNDTPIAFLNLDNGAEMQLDSWHWVTIVSLEYAENGSSAIIDILDAGIIKKIDLSLWFHSTKLGGGFISFELLK